MENENELIELLLSEDISAVKVACSILSPMERDEKLLILADLILAVNRRYELEFCKLAGLWWYTESPRIYHINGLYKLADERSICLPLNIEDYFLSISLIFDGETFIKCKKCLLIPLLCDKKPKKNDIDCWPDIILNPEKYLEDGK